MYNWEPTGNNINDYEELLRYSINVFNKYKRATHHYREDPSSLTAFWKNNWKILLGHCFEDLHYYDHLLNHPYTNYQTQWRAN